MPQREKAFSLIELMVTIAIIGILFGVVITASSAVRKNSRDAQRKSDLAKIQSALQNYYGDVSTYPATVTFGGTLTNPTSGAVYASKIPNDPSGTNYCYIPYVLNGGAWCSATPCQYYQLYAKLENSTGNSYSVCSGTYNYLVTPP